MKALNQFDKIFYINIDSHIERNQNFLKQFDNQEIDFDKIQRISAVTPENYGINNLENIVSKNNLLKQKQSIENYKHSMIDSAIERRHLNELCCSLSHSKVIEQILQDESEEGKYLVLEDDSRVNQEFLRNWDSISFNNPMLDYDLMYVGTTLFTEDMSGWMSEREYRIDFSLLDIIQKDQSQVFIYSADSGFFGTFGYVINKKKDNLDKLELLKNEFASGVIADFCLSSQSYLNKIAIEPFFIQTSETEQSTINQTKEYSDLNNLSRSQLSDIQKSKNWDSHPANAKINHYKQRFVFHRTQNNVLEILKHEIPQKQEDIKLFKSMIEILKKTENLKSLYYIDYSNIERPYYGIKTTII